MYREKSHRQVVFFIGTSGKGYKEFFRKHCQKHDKPIPGANACGMRRLLLYCP
jgi:hypothetical protein